MKLLKSKIFWVNIVGFGLQLLPLIGVTYPVDPKILALIQGVLTIILRQLQGTAVNLGGKSVNF